MCICYICASVEHYRLYWKLQTVKLILKSKPQKLADANTSRSTVFDKPWFGVYFILLHISAYCCIVTYVQVYVTFWIISVTSNAEVTAITRCQLMSHMMAVCFMLFFQPLLSRCMACNFSSSYPALFSWAPDFVWAHYA